jgi:hypothetical protein
MADTTVTKPPKWQYHDTNIQGQLSQTDFNRADRTVLFTAPAGSNQFVAVGLVQGFSNQEQKQLQIVFELGSANPMIIPGLTTGQLSLQRVLVNGYDFLNSIYRGARASNSANVTQANVLRSIRDTNASFNVMLVKYKVLTEAEEQTDAHVLSTIVFGGCHIQSRSESITAGGVVSMENVALYYQNIPRLTFK